MIPFRSPLTAHRKLDPSVSVFLPEVAARTARWVPATNQPATLHAATVPSLADAIAKVILYDDVISDPSLLLGVEYIHLTPDGNRLEDGFRTRYPRYVYVYGGNTISTALAAALAAAYAPLASIGCRLLYGPPLAFFQHPHTIVVPISGGTFPFNGYVQLEGETDDYDAGELFMAVVQENDSNTVLGTYNWVADDPLNTYAVVTNFPSPVNYTLVENVAGNRLMINTAMADYDAALAQPHIDRYKKFRQQYFLPIGGINGLFTTTYEQLLGMINPAGHPSANYTDAVNLASQIVSSAVDFFST